MLIFRKKILLFMSFVISMAIVFAFRNVKTNNILLETAHADVPSSGSDSQQNSSSNGPDSGVGGSSGGSSESGS